jgi:hypothetical protein
MLYGRNDPPDNSAGKAEIQILRAPPRKERLKWYLRFGIKTVIAKYPGGERLVWDG